MRNCTVDDRVANYNWRKYDCQLPVSSKAELLPKENEIEASIKGCFPGGNFHPFLPTGNALYEVTGRTMTDDPFQFRIAADDMSHPSTLELGMLVTPCGDPMSEVSVLCGHIQLAMAEPLSGPGARDPFYSSTMFCPAGSQEFPQHRFTDVYGDIFAKQAEIRQNDQLTLRPCKPDSATDNKRERWVGEVFRITSSSPAACPRGTVPADGRLMSPKENERLFSLLATTWGGDFNTTFGLPDLRLKAAEGGGIFCIVTAGPFPQRQ